MWLALAVAACSAEPAGDTLEMVDPTDCAESPCSPDGGGAASDADDPEGPAADDDGGSTGAPADPSTSGGSPAPSSGECSVDAECHFDADCIEGSCVDCSCVVGGSGGEVPQGDTDGDEGTTGATATDAYGPCEAGCLAEEEPLDTAVGCVCSAPCDGFGQACPVAPAGAMFGAFCYPTSSAVGEFSCLLLCEDDTGCPDSMICDRTNEGNGLCVHP